MSVDKLKSGIASFGSTIVDKSSHLTENILDHGSGIKDTLTFKHKDYDKDDELIKHYKYDIEKSIGGLKYIDNQTKRLYKTHFNRLFKLNIGIIQKFISIIGKDSLHFKGIEDYYNDFDKFQATQVIPMIHPKEKEFIIQSINHELYNYLSSIERLKGKIQRSWELHSESIHLRISEMNSYLTETLKLIKKRNKKKNQYGNLDKKIAKLSKKSSPLDDKETEKLKKYEKDLKNVHSEFNKLNDKLKSILPHVISFLDEFIETITCITLTQQVSTYKQIKDSLKYFSLFHGYLNSDNENNDNEDRIQTYQTIEDQWEQAITPTRLQIESFITVIFNKKPELLDTEIEDKDKTNVSTKIWNKMTSKVTERKHEHKSKDHINGTFNDYLEVDPLDAYIKYEDNHMNRPETYFPSRIIPASEVSVPKPKVNANLPPLPPRSNTAGTSKLLPIIPPPSTPNSRSGSISTLPPYSANGFNSSFSSDSYNDEDIGDIDDMSSIKSDISVESASSDFILQYSNPDLVSKNLKKVYNSQKNDIKLVPITTKFINNPITNTDNGVFNKTSSASYKLIQINEFFNKLTGSTQKDHRIITALYDYDGVEPGDLSFKKGDQIEVLFDFQQIDTLYNEGDVNWLIGSTSGKSNSRIGFIPSNYFS
ncbi:uncharacterized protein RJT21DRAFT_2112 [Scheffersomyces amazonensis]|uniref:uncharacterized protein n=1 Tax=Scheffersomyces amazonensis TaxID=1078765 RepID=UPI00315D0E16